MSKTSANLSYYFVPALQVLKALNAVLFAVLLALNADFKALFRADLAALSAAV